MALFQPAGTGDGFWQEKYLSMHFFLLDLFDFSPWCTGDSKFHLTQAVVLFGLYDKLQQDNHNSNMASTLFK